MDKGARGTRPWGAGSYRREQRGDAPTLGCSSKLDKLLVFVWGGNNSNRHGTEHELLRGVAHGLVPKSSWALFSGSWRTWAKLGVLQMVLTVVNGTAARTSSMRRFSHLGLPAMRSRALSIANLLRTTIDEVRTNDGYGFQRSNAAIAHVVIVMLCCCLQTITFRFLSEILSSLHRESPRHRAFEAVSFTSLFSFTTVRRQARVAECFHHSRSVSCLAV